MKLNPQHIEGTGNTILAIQRFGDQIVSTVDLTLLPPELARAWPRVPGRVAAVLLNTVLHHFADSVHINGMDDADAQAIFRRAVIDYLEKGDEALGLEPRASFKQDRPPPEGAA